MSAQEHISERHSKEVTRLLDRISYDVQAQALKVWAGRVESAGRFTRADVASRALGFALPNATLLDVCFNDYGFPADYAIRIEGRNVAGFFGASEKGELFSNLYDRIYRFTMEPKLSEVVTTRSPSFAFSGTEAGENVVVTFTELLLPVCDESDKVTNIVSVYDFRMLRRNFPTTAMSLHTQTRQLQNARRREQIAGARLK